MMVARERIRISGIVQGVGFRPFVYRVAKQFNLKGFVKNNNQGVLIEIEGHPDSLQKFHARLINESPPLSKIISIDSRQLIFLGDDDFKIIETSTNDEASTLISPDITVCDDCLRELFDPQNRRYAYPFINCTNCGPRYSIIESIPYDRSYTSMHSFKMCKKCEKEYNDPQNRRFHAQPNACPVCGPKLTLLDSKGKYIKCGDLIKEVARCIKLGSIIAIRGLGGFHLAVDPYNDTAIQRLRDRKGRQDKPFALMAWDVETIKKHCLVSELEESTLKQLQRPIVLLRSLPGSPISPCVAPKNNYFGFMLPYTPLHFLLMQHFDVLVMTSANFTDEPIAIRNDEAVQRLGSIADYFLVHDREILQRCDDSIVRISGNTEQIIRRSRGYVPGPVFISERTHKNILAVGGELKNTIALASEEKVIFSQHIGDLENPEAFTFFKNSISHLEYLLQLKPDVIACDMHPEYLSTKWAKDQDLPVIEIQHHHAHLASVLAENHINEPVIGIILDGTGYGTDGTIWGGEVLIGDAEDFERYAWLQPVAMPGASSVIKEPWRMAYSYLKSAYGGNLDNLDLPVLRKMDAKKYNLLDQMISRGINTPLTSSCGRLFDAVSCILNICNRVTFEAQAAIELEMMIDASEKTFYENVINSQESFSGSLILNQLILAITEDKMSKKPVSKIAAKFHNTLAELLLMVAIKIKEKQSIKKVALSGGVYQNVYFSDYFRTRLERSGFDVISHEQIPANDGGLALGQVAVAIHNPTLNKEANNN